MTTATLIESDRPGNGLAKRLRRAERAMRLRAFLLVLPLLLFVIVAFVLPIGQMLFRSIDNTAPCRLIPATCLELQSWDGSGLPGEAVYASFARELAQLFIPFHRGSNGNSKSSDGAGLGLAIAERAFRLHGGTVTAANANGGGLTVTLELPMLRATRLSPSVRALVGT